jgi:hypothetical protein
MSGYGQILPALTFDSVVASYHIAPAFIEVWPRYPGAAVTAQATGMPFELRGADKFYGLGGPSYDYPNPRAYRQPSVVYGLTGNAQFQLGFLASIPALAFSSDAATVTCTASDSPSGQQWSGPGYMAKYEIDTSIQLRGVFMNPLAGVPIDPTLVQLFVMDPNGNVTDYSGSVIRDAVGRYHLVIEPGLPGTWTYKWQGTGAAAATSPDTIFTVAPSLFLT